MQTFLPYPNFIESAKCLDYKRLGKQRIEVLQILKAIHYINYGWQNHPAIKMWKNFHFALVEYGIIICNVWKEKGYKDSCLNKIKCFLPDCEYDIVYPTWFGDDKFHSSHRAALLAKKYDWYSLFGWQEKPMINYYWPE